MHVCLGMKPTDLNQMVQAFVFSHHELLDEADKDWSRSACHVESSKAELPTPEGLRMLLRPSCQTAS